LPRQSNVNGLLTDELRTKFYTALKEAEPAYVRGTATVSKRLQRVVFEQCKDFSERCAFRRYLMERHELHYSEVVHEQELYEPVTTGALASN
jgi:hypothetical protein